MVIERPFHGSFHGRQAGIQGHFRSLGRQEGPWREDIVEKALDDVAIMI